MEYDHKITFIRGATTASGNSVREIEDAVVELIDESYKQFTEAVAEGRNLPVEEVRKFADGRIFTGTQAKELGLVDEIGDEFVAREIAAKLVKIDPKVEPLTFGKKKKKILGLIPGSRIIEKIFQNIFFEVNSTNKILWLYKP